MDAEETTLAIAGGTGDHEEASGTMDLGFRDDAGTEHDFT